MLSFFYLLFLYLIYLLILIFHHCWLKSYRNTYRLVRISMYPQKDSIGTNQDRRIIPSWGMRVGDGQK